MVSWACGRHYFKLITYSGKLEGESYKEGEWGDIGSNGNEY